MMSLVRVAVLGLALLAAHLLMVPGIGGSLALASARPWDTDAGLAEARRASSRLVLGYYTPYDPVSWASIQAQAQAVDIVAAQWVTIDGCGRLTSDDDQTLKRFARSHGIRVFPSLLTLSGWLNHRLL